jgi:predicted outer membrane protein
MGNPVIWLADKLGRKWKGVNSDLSNGFSNDQLHKLRTIFDEHGREFDESGWSKDVDAERDRLILPVTGVRLSDQLFVDVRKFLCIRAPSLHPRIPERESPPVDADGIVSNLDVDVHAPSFKYIHEIWNNVKKRRVEGTVIISIGRISALVETWASTIIIRKLNLQDKIGIYLVSFDKHPLKGSNGRGHFFPMMGARVINDRRCLLSMPVPARYSSRSPIIESKMTADLIGNYADDLIDMSRNLTSRLENQIEDEMRREFEALVASGAEFDTQYGRIDNFDKVRIMMNRLCDFAAEGNWYPPLA